MNVPHVVNPSAIGNPDETPIVSFRIDPTEAYGFAVPLLDDLHDWLDKIHDDLPAYEQNQLRGFQRRIDEFISGDGDA